LNENKQKLIFLPFGVEIVGLGSFHLSYVNAQDKQPLCSLAASLDAINFFRTHIIESSKVLSCLHK